jgi:hypothetical protein
MDFKFNLHDEVYIKELKRVGLVKSIWIAEKGIKYEIRYFDSTKPQEVYFYEEELSLNSPKSGNCFTY